MRPTVTHLTSGEVLLLLDWPNGVQLDPRMLWVQNARGTRQTARLDQYTSGGEFQPLS